MDNEELDLELQEDNQEQIINRTKKKINSLSEKLGTSEKEKAELKEAKAKTDAELAEAKKDAEFFKNFNQVSSKYQGASEYQDKIRENANLGLSVEDATMLVLTKEGKYTAPAPIIERSSPAGGSASTGITDQSGKPLEKMSRDEMRSTIQDMEAKGEFKF